MAVPLNGRVPFQYRDTASAGHRGITTCMFCGYEAPPERTDVLRNHIKRKHTMETTVGTCKGWETIADDDQKISACVKANKYTTGYCWKCYHYISGSEFADFIGHECPEKQTRKKNPNPKEKMPRKKKEPVAAAADESYIVLWKEIEEQFRTMKLTTDQREKLADIMSVALPEEDDEEDEPVSPNMKHKRAILELMETFATKLFPLQKVSAAAAAGGGGEPVAAAPVKLKTNGLMIEEILGLGR